MSVTFYDIKKNFIKLVVQGVTQEVKTFQLTQEEVNNIIKYAKYHSVENIIYKGLKLSNISIPTDFEKICITLLQKALVQDCEYEEIINQLNSNRIYHLPLKGAILRKFYPSLELRNMCDIDILVQKEDLKKINNVFYQMGYKLEKEGGHHDVYIKAPYMNVEVHRTMLDEEHNDFKYYDNIWNKIEKVENKYSIKLSNEDFYIYCIVHAWKHFSEGGTGIKILIDIYYLLQKFPNLNFEYIYNELNTINLCVFGKCLFDLSEKIFKNEELSDDQMLLLDYIIDSGAYGNLNHSSTSGILKEENDTIIRKKNKFLMKRLFPPLKVLKQKYPVLVDKPILTPLYWFKRFFSVAFNKKRRKGYLESFNDVDQDKIEKIRKIKEITNI